jgi:hypothetical protein
MVTFKERIEEKLLKGRERIKNCKYFHTIQNKGDIKDFEQMCIDLYHLAHEFQKALKIRYERFKDEPEEIFLDHYQEEVGHCDMLRKWMIQMGLPDPITKRPSIPTERYISVIYRAAYTMNKHLSLLTINGAGEGTAQDFYAVTYNRLRELGFPKLGYWHLHAEVDQEHGNVAKYIPENMTEEEFEEALHYIDLTLDVIESMKESWA